MSVELLSHVTESESLVLAGIYLLGVVSGLAAAWLAGAAARMRRSRND